MSITKNQLKSIVKECLLEILSEGIGQTALPVIESAGRNTFKNQRSVTSSASQQHVTKTRPQPSHSYALKEAIKREAGGDRVLADILADTAANSLPVMLESDRAKGVMHPVGTVERVVAAATPDQLFGDEAASKWAALAFMDTVKK